jgi:tRNA 5-methylaminomethyl-2-thiouridine biosynthesis bifunctional protein
MLTVEWRDDGTPMSPRFGDVYRSAGVDGQGGWAQAQHVFLGGCGLWPAEQAIWAQQAQWRVLENGFGLGLNFLATWDAWRHDPQRPQLLDYVAIESWPVQADDLVRSTAPFAALQALAQTLARHWPALLAHASQPLGVSTRIDALPTGEQCRLTLYLCPAEQALPALHRTATSAIATATTFDSVYLDGFAPDLNPAMWTPLLMQHIAQLARPGTRAATWCVARSVRDALAAAGFQVHRVAGLPPKRHCLQAVYGGVGA